MIPVFTIFIFSSQCDEILFAHSINSLKNDTVSYLLMTIRWACHSNPQCRLNRLKKLYCCVAQDSVVFQLELTTTQLSRYFYMSNHITCFAQKQWLWMLLVWRSRVPSFSLSQCLLALSQASFYKIFTDHRFKICLYYFWWRITPTSLADK